MAGKVTIDLAMRHRLQWFSYLWAHGLRKADEHPTVTPYGCGTLYLFKIIFGVELKTGYLYQLNFFCKLGVDFPVFLHASVEKFAKCSSICHICCLQFSSDVRHTKLRMLSLNKFFKVMVSFIMTGMHSDVCQFLDCAVFL